MQKELIEVGFRIKEELYTQYKKQMKNEKKVIQEELSNHIKNQIDDYKIFKTDSSRFSNLKFINVTFRVESELYKEYKKILAINGTRVVRDLTSFIIYETGEQTQNESTIEKIVNYSSEQRVTLRVKKELFDLYKLNCKKRI